MLNHTTPINIILGSQSPRRRELMTGLDIPFSCVTIDADESYPADLKAGDIPMYIARAKARAYMSELKENDLLITSDTIVWLNGEMLGKPQDEADAKAMLARLSGQTHEVYTAVCFVDKNGELETWVDCTKVTFNILSEEDINYYVTKYHPLDKAGAYGVQEWIGYVGVTRMEGSYFNVMGFPICHVYERLKKYTFAR
jgi:septum formation protein